VLSAYSRLENDKPIWRSKDCFLLYYVKYLTKKIYILWELISLLFHRHTLEDG